MEDLQEKIDSIMEYIDSSKNENEYAYVFFSVCYKAFLELGDESTAKNMEMAISALKGEIATDRGII